MRTTEPQKSTDACLIQRQLERGLFILLVPCVFGSLMVPEMLISKFGLPLPSFSNRLPYVAPFLLIFLWVVASYNSPRRKVIFRITWADFFILLNIAAWMIIEVGHSFFTEPQRPLEYLLPQIWLFFFYYGFREYAQRTALADNLTRLVFFAVLCVCVLQFVTILHLLPGERVSLQSILKGAHPDNGYLNQVSYIAVLGIWMELTRRGSQDRRTWRHLSSSLALTFFLALIIVSQTRGALLLVGVIIGLNLYFYSGNEFRKILHMFAAVACAGAALSLWLFMRQFESLDLILDESVRQRLKSLLLVWDSLHDNHLFGLGAAKSLEIKFENMVSHTYFVRILTAYGVIGLITLCLSIASMFYVKRVRLHLSEISGFFLVCATMMFESDLHWWYALVPPLVAINVNRRQHANEARQTSREAMESPWTL